MKIKFLIFFLAAGVIFGQKEDESKNVELPDFVITGVQSLNIPTRDKNDPELVSPLSEEFFRPLKTPEQISSSSISSPVGHPIDIFKNSNRRDNRLYLGAGIQTLPIGRLNLSSSFDHYLLNAEVFGSDQREFIDHAGYNVSGASLSNDFFISDLSDFLPGTKISLDAEYVRDSYYFYGSNNPQFQSLKRETHFGKGKFSFINEYSDNVNYGVTLSGRTYLIKDSGDITENLFAAGAFTKFKFNKLEVRLDGNYKKQLLENTNLEGSDYISGKIGLQAAPSEKIKTEAGFKYVNQDTNSYIIPYANILGELDDNIFIYAEYAPSADFLTLYDFVKQNRYFWGANTPNLVVDQKVHTKLAFRYKVDKQFEASAGLEISRSDDYPYFADQNNQGIFSINTLNNVKTVTFFANAMLHKSPAGYVYGDVQYSATRDAADNIVPYHPTVEASVNYGYDFDFNLSAEFSIDYAGGIYTDLTNNSKYDNYINAGMSLEFKLSRSIWVTLDLQNLLNRDNFFYLGYEEKPFDLIGGVKYHW